jgi:DNA-binding HxlR family transcriptional regulator
MIAQEYRLSPRQAMIIEGLLERLELRVEDLEKLLPRVNRRSLQRDLQGLVRRKIVRPVGAARAVRYRLRVKGL